MSQEPNSSNWLEKTEQAFFLILAENPDDEGARRVFADWLKSRCREADAELQTCPCCQRKFLAVEMIQASAQEQWCQQCAAPIVLQKLQKGVGTLVESLNLLKECLTTEVFPAIDQFSRIRARMGDNKSIQKD